jgi:hypothetical protein
MSDRHQEFVKKEDRKRNLSSLGFTLLIYLILLGVLWGWSLLFRRDLDMNQGPILIRLGEMDGADISTPAPPVEKPPEEAEPTPVEKEQPVSEPVKEDPLDSPEPIEKTSNGSPVVESPVVPSPVKEAAPVQPKVIKGSEAGNNYELTSEGGDIGHNLWTPIYLYMPLPRKIPAFIDGQGGLNSMLDNIVKGIYTVEESKALILEYYDKEQRTLVLKKPVPFDNRPELWSILEKAGYDMAKAEYKTARTLLPVTIYFEVEPSGSSQANKLTKLELKRESGVDEIDEAVLYAFQKSSYYNKSGQSIKGRFTYNFY